MSSSDVIVLCSDDEEENFLDLIQTNITCPPLENIPSHLLDQGFIDFGGSAQASTSQWEGQIQGFHVSDPLHLPTNGDHQFPSSRAVHVCRQFWKAGDYSPSSKCQVYSGGHDRLRVHPKFLHSNATSHKWAFGAVAELLDNAFDEVQKGATFVKLDKIKNPRDGKYALLIQDDGGGMGPDSLRRCMSFGFSDKCDESLIGQYGNGFKTSTMRLGADVLVFSKTTNERGLIQSVGLLSYTFLISFGFNDIIVPIVDYEFDATSCTFRRLIRNGERKFLSNLSIILDWSPFSSEIELLNQLDEIGEHGTRIIVFNLWLNDAGDMELDFVSDENDIMINGQHRPAPAKPKIKQLNEMHIANRFKYSLRAYASILYLHLPLEFRIILCGSVVDPHYIVNDLQYRECIKYKPHKFEKEVITTIGFLKGAPDLNIHGFSIYHRNRLVMPFRQIVFTRKSRGIAGVLEANHIKPTHDKQNFETSSLFQKLETRLRDMVAEYWKYHCHLVGYVSERPNPPPNQTETPPTISADETLLNSLKLGPAKRSQQILHAPGAVDPPAPNRPASTGSNEPNPSLCFEPVILGKRQGEINGKASGVSKKRAVRNDLGNGPAKSHDAQAEEKRMEEYKNLIVSENKKLRLQCLEYETAEKELTLKMNKLSCELKMAQQIYKGLLTELDTYNHVKM